MIETHKPLSGHPYRALEALNFFMADMQAGIGPYLGVFLLAHGWQSGLICTVMTLDGVAGMLVTGAGGRPHLWERQQAALCRHPRHLHRAGVRHSGAH